MNNREIIERLKNLAGYAVYTVGEKPLVMSLDDGIAVHEAIELLEKSEQWETCFDCPLSNGCPVINGCTNEQAMEYAGDIPDNCPLNKKSVESDAPDRNIGMWVGSDSQCGIGCPFCGKPVDDFCNSIDYIFLLYEPNFCPNCGAELKGRK